MIIRVFHLLPVAVIAFVVVMGILAQAQTHALTLSDYGVAGLLVCSVLAMGGMMWKASEDL